MPEPARPGTQSIDRAVLVLKNLAARGTVGWRLLDLAQHCALDRSTTHRILGGLVRARLAAQRPDRRYVAGGLVFELGVSMRHHAALQDACRGPLVRLAKSLNGMAIVSLRSDTDFVCVAREGRPVPAMTIEVGTRRPLITSVSGAAILVALPRSLSQRIVAQNVRALGRFDARRLRSLRTMIAESEAAGYGISLGRVVPNIGAVGYPVRNAMGEPVASVAFVAPEEMFEASRMPLIEEKLRTAVRLIESAVEMHLSHYRG